MRSFFNFYKHFANWTVITDYSILFPIIIQNLRFHNNSFYIIIILEFSNILFSSIYRGDDIVGRMQINS